MEFKDLKSGVVYTRVGHNRTVRYTMVNKLLFVPKLNEYSRARTAEIADFRFEELRYLSFEEALSYRGEIRKLEYKGERYSLIRGDNHVYSLFDKYHELVASSSKLLDKEWIVIEDLDCQADYNAVRRILDLGDQWIGHIDNTNR